jgi:hypothetical protein
VASLQQDKQTWLQTNENPTFNNHDYHNNNNNKKTPPQPTTTADKPPVLSAT